MKVVRNLFWVAVIVIVSILYTRYVLADSKAAFIVSAVILSIFMFHFAIRKSLSFKSYFLSPVNFLSGKFASKTSYDIPIDLMFEKALEVLEDTKFKVQHSDPKSFEIFATTNMSWQSWGENLYIDFTKENGKTIMNFHSVAVMQIHTWEKNRKNSEHLINTIEDSLII